MDDRSREERLAKLFDATAQEPSAEALARMGQKAERIARRRSDWRPIARPALGIAFMAVAASVFLWLWKPVRPREPDPYAHEPILAPTAPHVERTAPPELSEGDELALIVDADDPLLEDDPLAALDDDPFGNDPLAALDLLVPAQ